MIQKQNISLPSFCSWAPEEWRRKRHEYDGIRSCMLGWDITDDWVIFTIAGLVLSLCATGCRKAAVYA